ncbi:hypothetical protein B0T20DRAFT_118394 [Sordaria brevicollis]|uniref:Uncharacterized protein n=1 Tax=Sordaria brevicollis TaxID=83679 RepID=A0AAE0PKL8_SORBR|nr:hypothetical protein B0T20DRAFT_118394 [Sordaria brevicollis]
MGSLTPKASKATQNVLRNSLIADNKPTYYHASGHRHRPRSNTTGHQSLHRLIGPPTESTGFGVPASNSGGTIGSLNVQHIHGFCSPSRGNSHRYSRNNNHGGGVPDSSCKPPYRSQWSSPGPIWRCWRFLFVSSKSATMLDNHQPTPTIKHRPEKSPMRQGITHRSGRHLKDLVFRSTISNSFDDSLNFAVHITRLHTEFCNSQFAPIFGC